MSTTDKGKVLVTGGAGFIGSHLVEALLGAGHEVRIVDSLDPQAHGEDPQWPDYLEGAELINADVTVPDVWSKALDGVTHVVHFAAAVGLAQSMYEIDYYVRANVMGTAHLLQELSTRKYPIDKLLVASSMSIYGEGLYRCGKCGFEGTNSRRSADLEDGRWEMPCPECNADMKPIPTPETKTLQPSFVYSITKRDQEEMCLSVGRAYEIPTVALRFFSVYGPRQALSNPYTGVAAIFASRLLSGAPPLIFEDGEQTRDFIHVRDVVDACMKSLFTRDVADVALNIGTGKAVTISQVAAVIQKALGGPDSQVLGTYRHGDIRHCYPDVTAAERVLGWKAALQLEDGVEDLVEWVTTQQGQAERLDAAFDELRERGLVRDK
jgi:dTDP-L-rhamnose 4-epimerase